MQLYDFSSTPCFPFETHTHTHTYIHRCLRLTKVIYYFLLSAMQFGCCKFDILHNVPARCVWRRFENTVIPCGGRNYGCWISITILVSGINGSLCIPRMCTYCCSLQMWCNSLLLGELHVQLQQNDLFGGFQPHVEAE